MSSSARIDSFNPTVQVETTRTRQTPPPATPFRDVLAGGANVLMTGAEVASGVLGGPVLAAAVREAKSDVVGGIGGSGGSVSGGGSLGGGGGDAASTAAAMGSGSGTDMSAMAAMQRESQAFNLQLLNLQEDVQNESRRFTTVSNVVKAKYDTAMNAVRNIHS